MENTLKLLHKKLSRGKITIAVAESCTGGELSGLLTRYPGSSLYFILGIVAYSNKSKEKLLKIPHKIIKSQGAVSETVAALMAGNIRRLAKATIALSITGIAGPAGAVKNKPVGTVYICACAKNKLICRKFRFSGNRARIKTRASGQALKMLAELICAHSSA
ncbi:MAG: CinA family protein [Candidatus Omnitrophota bacterium]|jgi:nicotinamide-nucleotide amidase